MVLNTIGLGGVPEVAWRLMQRLPRDSYDLRLCVLKDGGGAEEGRRARLARYGEIGVPVHFATESGGKIDMVAAVADWIGREKIDILHTHSYRPNVYGRLAGAMHGRAGLRMIAHYHNQYDDKWDAEPAMLTLEKQLAGATDAMIAVSESVGRDVAERLGLRPDRIDVVVNGSALSGPAYADKAVARAAFGLDGGGTVFGLVGRVCEQKGQEDFVEAAIALAEKVADAAFVMFGDLEDKALHARLTDRIGETGLAKRILFAGHVSDMRTGYAALDVVVAPSRWEGFGLMLVEAMAAGLPIVATRAGAIPDVVAEGETAQLVPVGDVSALEAAMNRLNGDAALRARLGAAGIERSRAFSWERAAAAVDAIYRRVLAARG